VAVGWLMIFTVGYGDGYSGDLGDFLSSTAGKQTIWIGISLAVFSIIYFLIDWKLWRTIAYLIYAFSIVLLIAVLFFGNSINGATSWFAIGSFSFQPSEIAKFGTCLAMASFLSGYNTSLRETTHQMATFGIFLLPIS
jgi:rod shape determining protein RodA